MSYLLAFGIGYMEILLIAVVGVLVFGNRLPEVGKSLGKGIVEFKKGLRGIKEDIDQAETNIPEKREEP
jgi:sec-independent protein translocase protein TatA